ncbi:hypothetical protein RE474_11480 [Methanolobus sediminis]|uniref:Apea-like HEPN domain-containing protein n=1 Tax=Methanolobus sediminis TaxID=3072978 RepID=A0AA51UJU0_9EURY|nr:hypothetical protein [Methanolobus sediminis]WMW24694.1 hypothetical protein RE474_11480 [Methanolobus sediminis]
MSITKNDTNNYDRHLDFGAIYKECNEFYKDYSAFSKFNEEDKERFFADNLKVFSRYLYLVDSLGNNDLMDMKIIYTLFGVAYEYLLKICALKINWDEYLESYKSIYGNRNYKFVKEYVLNDLEDKLTQEQYERSEAIMGFVQLQRNHFVHSPFKGRDHYGVTKQIYELMAVLVVVYKLKLPKETVDTINANLNKHKVLSAMDFDDVEFKDYVDCLDDYAVDVPLFIDW